MKSLGLAAALIVATAIPASAAMLRVTSPEDDGPGSMREAILAANDEPGSTIEVAGGASMMIVVMRALPPIRGDGTIFNGRGATIRQSIDCDRPGRKRGCDGLVVEGPGVTVRNVRIAGFTFDGISVRGDRASDVRIEHVDAVDNLDDGIGVSDGAGPVTIEHCLVMGNGFRTKGKGLLVFSDAVATMRDSTVIANRDGVTVTRGSEVTLERVLVVANYDKGVGVSAAALHGRQLQILDNGREADGPSPNADGVRVGLGGSVALSDSRIAGNGDSGLVVLDTSSAKLSRCEFEANHGDATRVAATAHLDRR